MKVLCKQQDLVRGLSVVNHAVSSRSTLPILTNILLSTDLGRLKLSSTNLEMGIECWIDAEIHEDGAMTVPAKLFTELAGSLDRSVVEMCVDYDTLKLNVKSPGSSANLRGTDPTEFPHIPTVENDRKVVLDATELKTMISQVCIAAASDDSRPVFTGIHIELGGGMLTLAGADSFRLAVHTVPLPGTEDQKIDILIPAPTLKELARILPSSESVEMIVTPNKSQALFRTPEMTLVTRLLEGTFPNFRAAIPKQHTTEAVVTTKEFAATVKSVMPFARDSSNIIRVNVCEETLVLEAESADLGNNTGTIQARISGPDQRISFNIKYLSDVLEVIQTPEVVLGLTTAAQPGVIKPVGEVDYTYTIMPMTNNR